MRPRNHLAILILCFLVFFSSNGKAQDSIAVLQYFPEKKVFPLLRADGLAHQFSISRITDNNNWIAAIGGSIPILQLNLHWATIQGSAAVTTFNRIIKTPGHITVHTIDYKVDIPVDIRFEDIVLQVGIGHISCHFADDAIELLGQRSIQHVNDYFRIVGAYDVAAIGGRFYAGFNYSYGTQPIQHRPWLLQIGTDFGNVQLTSDVSAYGAIDLKVRQEAQWGSTRSFQIGFILFPRGRFDLRIAYTLRMGHEERGQFYLNRETLNLISAFIDF